MPVDILHGTDLTSEDKLEKLRGEIRGGMFQDAEKVRQFIGHYATLRPSEFVGRGPALVQEAIAGVRAELGLADTAQPQVTAVVSAHVRDLVSGRAAASEDTARWAVHHGTGSVTMHSGQFTFDAEDIVIDGAGMDFVFRRCYKSNGFYSGPLGVNWDHGYNLRLRVDGSRIARLSGAFSESGYIRHERYGQAGFNYWVPPPGEHSIIVDLSDVSARREYDLDPAEYQPGGYGLRTADGTWQFYETEPGRPERCRVRRIRDRHGNYLAFRYRAANAGDEEALWQVEVNNGLRVVVFEEYDEFDRILRIRDYAGRSWHFSYDDRGDLSAVTTPGTERYPGGLTERYLYTTPQGPGDLEHKLVQVYDTAGRLSIDNEYGSDRSLLSFGRVVRQREGAGERSYEYQDVSLVLGLPAGQPAVEEDLPAHQTTMIRRNGHPIHFIHNSVGNLIAREEEVAIAGARRSLVVHYRYNRDGAVTGEASPEGRLTQYLWGRDDFVRRHHARDLSEDELRRHAGLTWQERLRFGHRMAVVQRHRPLSPVTGFQFPGPVPDMESIAGHPDDIIVKFTHDDTGSFPYQNVAGVSDPRWTNSPFADGSEHPRHPGTRTAFRYDPSNRLLERIEYPTCTRDGQDELTGIAEAFLSYDARGRLLRYADQMGTRTELAYFAAVAHPAVAEALKEGYLCRRVVDPKTADHPSGLDLTTEYDVNLVGRMTRMTTWKAQPHQPPRKRETVFAVDDLNRITKVTRALRPGVEYEVRYIYCRNRRIEQIERDVRDEDGNPLWGGTQVQFFGYNENDLVITEEFGGPAVSDRLTTSHLYDDGDLRVGTRQPGGNLVRIVNDERRMPVAVDRGAGTEQAARTRLVYDGDGLLVEHRDGRGLKTEFAYDAFGRLVETREYGLGPVGPDGQHRDVLFRIVRQDYDKAGNLRIERLFSPHGHGFRLLYHAEYVYNELNQRIEVRRRLFESPLAYSAAQVAYRDDTVPLHQAVRTLSWYDRAGRLTRVEQHGRRLDDDGKPEEHDTVLTSVYHYNAVGWVVEEIDPIGNRTKTGYDEHGLVTRVDVHEQAAGSPTGVEVFTTLYEHDDLDRLTSITDPLGNVTRFGYDSVDAVVWRRDPLDNVTRYEYDVFGREVAERVVMTETGLGGGPHAPGMDTVTRFDYDRNGNLTRLLDAEGNAVLMSYDALDRRVEVRLPDGTVTTSTYDGNDNVVEERDANGLIRRTAYDALDNVLSVTVDTQGLAPGLTVEGTTAETFEHDALGQLVRATNEFADIRRDVDSLGRVFQERVSFPGVAAPFVLVRQHDDFDFTRRLTYPGGRRLLYEPDALNRITHIYNQSYGAWYPGRADLPPLRLLAEDTYTGLRRDRRALGNGASTRFAYDGAGRTIEIRHADAQGNNLVRLQHLFDAAGNLRLHHEYGAVGAGAQAYRYDSAHQLTDVRTLAAPGELDLAALAPRTAEPAGPVHGQAQIDAVLGPLEQTAQSFTFRYDRLGSRLEERAPNQDPVAYQVNDLSQYEQRDHARYDYDRNGNMRSRQRAGVHRGFFYDHRDRLVRVAEAADLARFRHDALGRRVWSDTGGTQTYYLYDGDDVIEEWRGVPGAPPKPYAQYVNEAADSRVHLAVDGAEYWYHQDLVASTRVLSGMDGKAAAAYHFTAFGEPAGGLPPVGNRYLFGGRHYDELIQSYDFRARQYDPVLGRFLQRDARRYADSVALADHAAQADLDFAARAHRPTVRHIEANLYTYALNNPLVARDPSGLQTSKWIEGGLQSVRDWTVNKLPGMLGRTGVQPFFGEKSPYASWDEQRRREHLHQWNLHHPEPIRRMPKQKGCYGWAIIHIQAAYKRAGKAERFGQILKVAQYPTVMARELRKDGWKVVYFASDFSEVPAAERDKLTHQGVYSRHNVPVDDRVVNFAPTPGSGTVKDVRGLRKLEKIGFWWGTTDQGHHSFVWSGRKINDFNWATNPNANPVHESNIAHWLRGRSGIILVPPGTQFE